MYFKKAGNKTQVLAYRGYDREKKRAIVKMVGSIYGQEFSPSVRQIDSITDDEKQEIQSYIEKAKQDTEKAVQRCTARYLPDRLEDAISALKNGEFEIETKWAEQVWIHIDELGRLLRKGGYGKHKTIRGKTDEKSDSKTESK